MTEELDASASKERKERRRGYELINRGARLLHEGQATEAIPILEHALALLPDDVSAAINLGGAYILAGKHRQAVPILEHARDIEPDNVMVWINLGAAYLDRPPYTTPEGEEKAIRAFERALELNPVATSVSYNLGLIYKDRGDLQAALVHFAEAIRADPLDRDARYWHARILSTLHADATESTDRSGE